MRHHPDLLRHDVQSLAQPHPDLDQSLAVVQAGTLRFEQLVTDFRDLKAEWVPSHAEAS